MKNIWAAGILLVFAVSAGAQEAPDNSNPMRGPMQSGGIPTDAASREDALTRASLDMIHKQYADAADIFRELLRTTPNDSVLWNRLGIAYHQQSLLGDALKCYERAAKVSKGGGDAWNNMGTVYFQEHKLSKAIRTYKKAIGINSQNATFYSNLGIAYLNEKHVPEALDAFRQAVKLDPEVFGQTGSVGTILQDRSVSNPGMFFFMLAKSFAVTGNAERCAYYLRKSRDEGYTDFEKAKTDPAFSGMLTNPSVREVLGMPEISSSPGRSQGI
jgi:tetratricopeptide (TPR) repeat protein